MTAGFNAEFRRVGMLARGTISLGLVVIICTSGLANSNSMSGIFISAIESITSI